MMSTPWRIVIVEDEQLAAERLAQLLAQVAPAARVADVLDSVAEAVAWFQRQPPPDLAFFDIQLADGLSFDIFERCAVPCPVIFTTAYDHYAVKAFKVNSVDYLLKPLNADDLRAALDRFAQRRPAVVPDLPQALLRAIAQATGPSYKSRYLVRSGAQLLAVPTADVLYFFHEHKVVWLKRRDGKKYAVDFTLEELETQLDPAVFFRLNRRYIAAFEAIGPVTVYSNQRLRVALPDPPDAEPVLVSRERASAFREWLEGGRR